MIEVRELWKVPVTAIVGALVAGILLVLASDVHWNGRVSNFFFDLFLGFTVSPAAAIWALPWTLLGTVSLFLPMCHFFGRKRLVDLFAIMAFGSIMGFALSQFITAPEFYLDYKPSPPPPPHKLFPPIGILFGATTGLIGWLLMSRKNQEAYDG